MKNIGIIGAGIAGLHLGLQLRQQDLPATIYTNRTPDWRYSMEVSDGPQGAAPCFAVVEAEFPGTETFRNAMGSPEGKAVADDVPNYPTGGAVVGYAVTAGGASK